MKSYFDKNLIKKCLYVFLTGTLLMLVWKLLSSSENIISSAKIFFNFWGSLLFPMFLSIFIAYLLTPIILLLKKLLGKIFKKHAESKWVDRLSVSFIYLSIIAVLVLAIVFAVPALVDNASDFVEDVPGYVEDVQTFFVEQIEPSEIYKSQYVQSALSDFMKTVDEQTNSWAINGISWLLSATYKFAGVLLSIGLGFLLSIYLVVGKNNLVLSLKRTLTAKGNDTVWVFLKDVDQVFGRFITSRMIESFIVYILAQIAFAVIGVKYSVLMATLVGITNFIPYIGPWIGGIIPVLIMLLENPISALFVVGTLILIQFVDGMLLQPNFTGERLGLNPFWVLIAILVGGGIAGLWGVLLAAPTAGVIKLIIERIIKYYSKRNSSFKDNSPLL